MDTLDILKRDRFELLSCYLDGEVTAAERKQVENWLATDPEIQHLHARLLKLRHGFQSQPVPTSQPVEQMVEQVFDRIDRRPKLRLILGIAGAVAAVAVGALTSVLPGSYFNPQMAEQVPAEQSPEALMLALDHPPIDIPKAPAAKSSRQAPQNPGLYAHPSQDIR